MAPPTYRSPIRSPSLPVARPVLIVLGLLLWTINLVYNRPLFIDEANVARNLFDRSFAGLFLPLDHEQYAPPLYLVATKAVAEVFGYSELPLRLPAFLGGLLAVFGLVRAGRHLELGYWGLLPLALLFVNPTVLRFVTEVKPYGIDLGVSAVLVALHLRPRPLRLSTWALIGVICPWLSLSSVFVLAAIGLDGLRTHRGWLLPIGSWLGSFGLLYALVLSASVGSDYLNAYHNDFFFPLPDSWPAVRQIGSLLTGVLRLSFGFTVLGLLWGGLLLAYGLLKLPLRYRWLILPLLAAVAASALRQYSLIERLMLFVLPPLWLVSAAGAREAYLSLSKASSKLLLAATLIVLGGTNIYPAYFHPYRFSDGRKLAAMSATAAVTYVHPEAVPVVDYYTRIHPQAVVAEGEVIAGLPDGSRAGTYTMLFDVTTQEHIAEAALRVASDAAARGCQVNREELFRAEGLRIRCPVPNSGR